MILVTAELRRLLLQAGVNIAKFLGGMLLGIVLMLSAGSAVIGGATAVTMFGFVSTGMGTATNAGGTGFDVGIPPIQLAAFGGGRVGPNDVYLLAVQAGWKGEDAVVATAISLAEDPRGDPAAEHVNNDIGPTIDKGLWQINSGKPPDYHEWTIWGGREALADPATNAWAAHTMWTQRGFQPWSTFNGGQYLAHMADARAAARAATLSAADYTFPLPGWTGQINLHWGVAIGGSDLFAPRGQPIVSVAAGRVLEAGWDRVGGNAVLIAGDDGLQYYYAHFDDAPAVRANTHISSGILLGHVGNTGDADRGPTHLHIGIGHTILLGADAYGGTGSGFDAVKLLRDLYAQMHGG
jgi:murein DD-endopeptidase MepM/ murein hydrolase activator NlpD